MRTYLVFSSLAVGLFLGFTSCDSEIGDPTADCGGCSYADNAGGFTGGSGDPGGENYAEIIENPFIKTDDEPISTFSIDADGAAYANMRRMIREVRLPERDAIRTEELVNYFQFDYPDPATHPIALNGEISECPWAEGHKLIRIGIKGKSIAPSEIPSSNFVLLIDVSGSMKPDNKLPLLKKAFSDYVMTMRPEDRIAIVTYAGSAGVVLESTSGHHKAEILNAIAMLESGGSTAGAAGLRTAYEIASQNFIHGGNNRIILGTDGDFNVGQSSTEELVKLIEEERDRGIFITVLGVGTGNLNDNMLELISNNGNGTYEYLDTEEEARRVFLYEAGKFFIVAKDVKVQIEFNPRLVAQYRLIGYENRLLETEDFEDDKKDAGDIGAGQTITALYEIIPVSTERNEPSIAIDFRYKEPDSDQSKLLKLEILDDQLPFALASENMRFAAAVASFGLLIRDSQYKGVTSFDKILQWAQGSMSYDPHGYRSEFLELVNEAKGL